jgi:hypothetical protein
MIEPDVTKELEQTSKKEVRIQKALDKLMLAFVLAAAIMLIMEDE